MRVSSVLMVVAVVIFCMTSSVYGQWRPMPDRVPIGQPIRFHIAVTNTGPQIELCSLQISLTGSGRVDMDNVLIEAVQFSPATEPVISGSVIRWEFAPCYRVQTGEQIEVVMLLPTTGVGTVVITPVLTIVDGGQRIEVSDQYSVEVESFDVDDDDVQSVNVPSWELISSESWEQTHTASIDEQLIVVATVEDELQLMRLRDDGFEVCQLAVASGVSVVRDQLWWYGKDYSGGYGVWSSEQYVEVPDPASVTEYSGDVVIGCRQMGVVRVSDGELMEVGEQSPLAYLLASTGELLYGVCCDVLWVFDGDKWRPEAATMGDVVDLAGGRGLTAAVSTEDGFAIYSYGHSWKREMDLAGEMVVLAGGRHGYRYVVLQTEDSVQIYRQLAAVVSVENDGQIFYLGRGYGAELAPFIREGRMFVGVRDVIELLGGQVSWCVDTRSVASNLGGQTLVFSADDSTVMINDAEVDSQVEVDIVHGRFVISVRDLGQLLGYEVAWCPLTSQAYWK